MSCHVLCVVYRADLERNVVKPVTKATVGQFCCAYFSEDKQWHRARVVTMVSTSHVSYSTSMTTIITSNVFVNRVCMYMCVCMCVHVRVCMYVHV